MGYNLLKKTLGGGKGGKKAQVVVMLGRKQSLRKGGEMDSLGVPQRMVE